MKRKIRSLIFLIALFFICLQCFSQIVPINRYALVSRHNVVITVADSLNSLSVGNGNFAFTVGITGLQSFPDYYANGIPLGTESNWGWHSFPNDSNYNIDDVEKKFISCNGRLIPYAVQHSSGRAGRASDYLRSNPQRIHLGILGLELYHKNGTRVKISEIKNIHQKLDLWSGKISSRFAIDGETVEVITYCHQDKDLIAVKIHSPLIAAGRLKIFLHFPYANAAHTGPGYDFNHPEKYKTNLLSYKNHSALLQQVLDTTIYYTKISWNNAAVFSKKKAHYFILVPDKKNGDINFTVEFNSQKINTPLPDFAATEINNKQAWKKYWSSGGAIDFSACTDPRAKELERRIILSQYLTRIQCAGNLPPQETGLTYNSWYGKFHLEMHWWHGVHFALWNHLDLLEKSLQWYRQVLPKAIATARWQGYDGARWQKMTGPKGNKSPSSVGELLIWQEPHIIYFAHLVYRQHPTKETLLKYKNLVFETANFMASFAHYDSADHYYHLCHPLIPAQEIFKAGSTDDPAFELAYWYYALSVAQKWWQLLGLGINKKWQNVLDHLAPLPVSDGKYLPAKNVPDAYSNDFYRRDHPIVMGILGMLPQTKMVDKKIMNSTYEEVMKKWNWPSTWGWDYPMIAMTAARLGRPEDAVNALLMNVQKNTYLPNGHNYQDKRLRIYLPGNGGLLTAVAMMAAGWDGAPDIKNPGFPQNGKWDIKWEGLKKMP